MLNIYITDLAAYNNGFLVGEWVTLPTEEETLAKKIKEILELGSKECGFNDEHEEYFITDYEFQTEYKILDVSEYSNPYTLNKELEKLEGKEEYELKQISFMVEYMSYDLDYAVEHFEDVIIYEDMSLRDIVEDYLNQTLAFDSLPSIVANNIDYDSIMRDFEMSGEYTVIENVVYHFVN